MSKCHLCGHENIQGVDNCEECYCSLVWEESQTGKSILYDSIRKVNLRSPIIVSPNATMRDVIAQMKKKDLGCVLIVENKKLVGIFTERDMLRKVSKPEADLDDIEIENVMTPSPEILGEDATVCDALNKMAMGNFRHVPIRKDSGEYSYFSVRDALRYLF